MSSVDIQDKGHARVLIFSNPPKNLMTAELSTQLLEQVRIAAEDPDVRVLIFASGHSETFIQHYDVTEILALREAIRSGALSSDIPRSAQPFFALCDTVDALSKPTIAAINGTCMGGGYEFALCCDIRLAQAGRYPIGLPESRLGILPGGGGTQRLARLIGTGAALNLILRGRIVPPDEALRLGLIHEIAAGSVNDTAVDIARQLAELPIDRLAAIKRLVKNAAMTPLEEGLGQEARAFVELVGTSDAAHRAMEDYVDTGQEASTLRM